MTEPTPSPAKLERTRGYAHRIDVRAPAPPIWAALTTTGALTQWCAPDAEIDARPGGSFRASVDRVTEFEAHIDVFTPPRRLRLLYLPSPALPPECAMVDDFVLDEGNAGTIVRLLSSGIPGDVEWDEMYLRLRVAWERALSRLKVFVERELR
ncbi:MAG TPA: SRPBCC domain-containing protein [Steroidobacteraceae bacterium]|nr:SRPBCC domain-containing protein [Steroidobacteraceae bacterium]